MKKLFIVLAFLPLLVACKKSSDLNGVDIDNDIKPVNSISNGVSTPVVKTPALLSQLTFENFSLKAFNVDNIEAPNANSIQLSDSVARSGRFSLRFQLNKSDAMVADSKRAEIITKREKTANIERWYKLSTFLPKDYAVDSVPECLVQWHEMPDTKLGETWRSPAISLQIIKNQWALVLKWAKSPVNTNETLSGSKTIYLGKFVPGQWTDWVFHIKYSYEDDGVTQLWQNGNLIVDRIGPNYYNDQVGPFMKIGFYKWNWKDTKSKSILKTRVAFFDDVKVGDKGETFATFSQK